MKSDLGDRVEQYMTTAFPRLRRLEMHKIDRTSVHVLERTHRGAFKTVSESHIRVATIGRTFLDMIREPQLCGGIQHVVDVYRENAKSYLRLIVDEIDLHGNSIDKVRAGYLLTEVCQLENERMKAWERFAQRGGSRKLDAEAEYSSSFSDRWKLSINVPGLASQG